MNPFLQEKFTNWLSGANNLRAAVTNYSAPVTMTTVDLSTDADVVVTSSPAVLLGIYVNVVLSAHVVLIRNNLTTMLTMPASTAAGTDIFCHGATFSTNITVESNDAATGTITVFWRAA